MSQCIIGVGLVYPTTASFTGNIKELLQFVSVLHVDAGMGKFTITQRMEKMIKDILKVDY